MEILEDTNLINARKDLIPAKTILTSAKYILYFFSASTCEHSKKLLPIMKDIYKECSNRHIALEIIYVSQDLDKEEMMQHFQHDHGTWYAVPFQDAASRHLTIKYGITHIPFIIVSKNDGTTITSNGVKDIQELGVNVLTVWIE